MIRSLPAVLIRLSAPFLVAWLSGCATPASSVQPGAGQSALVERILAADDARGRGPGGLAPLLEGAASSDAGVRRLAVRALGRIEADSLVPAIAPLLTDPAAGVRAEAANALGQAVLRAEPAAARSALIARLDTEPDAWVRGVIGQTLGRLRHATPTAAAETARSLARIDADNDSGTVALAKGFFFLARQQPARGALPADALERLRQLPDEYFRDEELAARTRTMVVAALAAARAATLDDLERALRDPHPLVRREAAAALPLLPEGSADASRLVESALRDPAGVVRTDALRSYARLLPGSCAGVRTALGDPEPHVALLAIDLVPAACPIDPGTRDRLILLANGLDEAGEAWHRAAHALLALATLQPDAARAVLPSFTGHANPFVRAYGARAAAALRVGETLRWLAADPDPNVRTAAIEGLTATVGHAADDVYVEQLASDDAQLIMTAAGALEGSTAAGVTAALLDALDRISGMRRETSRDARVALLQRARELGTANDAARVRAYLADFDPAVAAAAADAVGAWTGQRPTPAPVLLPHAPVPSAALLDSLARAEVVLAMRGEDPIVLRLRPWLAPTNAARFARLARAGFYDGLTFHRVAANFVVQGGSPHANEYAGDGPFSRDELGIDGNWRGTVGLSTRGRDTGDAQLYINIIDNIRLDHDYTVFAEVVQGMDVVDRLMEGAVIERVSVR
jgi:cyclophilin family peptidyl-prolyl cis-trans isomerase/HEAT repeat protein